MSDEMRWNPAVEEETDRPVPIYGHDPARDAVHEFERADALPLNVPEDNPLAYLEEELERRFGRSRDRVPAGSRGAPRSRPRGPRADQVYMDEVPPTVRNDPRRPPPSGLPLGPLRRRVVEVEINIRMAGGLEERITIEEPGEVQFDQRAEPELIDISSMGMFREMVGRWEMREIALRIMSPRRWRAETRRWAEERVEESPTWSPYPRS